MVAAIDDDVDLVVVKVMVMMVRGGKWTVGSYTIFYVG